MNIAALNQLLLDLCQILLLLGNFQRGRDGFQMINFCLDLLRQRRQRFIGAFELSVTVKVPLGIFLRGERGSKGIWMVSLV